MDSYGRLKHLIESLCTDMDLQSWTTHENMKGVTVTLRFTDLCGVNSGKSESETWVKKKPYAVKRDRERMDKFNKSKSGPLRQSERLQNKSIDKLRFDHQDLHSETVPISPEVITPASPVSLTGSPFQVNASSPECCGAEIAQPEPVHCTPQPVESPKCVEMPSMPTMPAMDDCSHLSTSDSSHHLSGDNFGTKGSRETFEDICSEADLVSEINRDLLFSHVSEHKPELLCNKSFLTEIKCCVCGITLSSLKTRRPSLRSMRLCKVGKGPFGIYGCNKYICSYNSCKRSHDSDCSYRATPCSITQ